MIDKLDANKNLGKISIKFSNDCKWNSELVTKMTNKYSNLYGIHIFDNDA